MMNISLLITKGKTMFRCKRFLKLSLLGLCISPVVALADPLYSLTFLPQDFYAAGINSSGQVVGTAGGGAAIWSSPGAVTSLGSLLPGSEGLGINNRGDIVGRDGSHGFIYANGLATGIVTGLNSWATGINDAGQVTGTALSYESRPSLAPRKPTAWNQGPIAHPAALKEHGLKICGGER
jgi:uncharacterized membrane protein